MPLRRPNERITAAGFLADIGNSPTLSQQTCRRFLPLHPHRLISMEFRRIVLTMSSGPQALLQLMEV